MKMSGTVRIANVELRQVFQIADPGALRNDACHE
jgi:hypothetical protein